MRVRSLVLVSLAIAASTITALAAAGVVTVSQKNRAFTIAKLEIAKGDVVRFINDDRFRHQIYVSAPSFNFESDEQAPGTTVNIQFSKSGVFEVRCHIHPKMLLQVDVH